MAFFFFFFLCTIVVFLYQLLQRCSLFLLLQKTCLFLELTTLVLRCFCCRSFEEADVVFVVGGGFW
jgi:hypothetical protein